ncbi:MAG: hypothetical protein Q8M29_15235 [Bacteroidota bacterium]|nr:hypothetical protein [Bacteroidota bacterium]
MKIQPIAILFIIAFLAANYSSLAAGAGPPPPGGGTGPTCWPPPCVPIDGGITFLLLAGAAYGSKKVYDLKKNKVNP